jgi:co-chaperonin GroES (HSP10)
MSVYINKVTKIRALRDHILVTDMNFAERFTNSGIFIPGDDGKSSGIRPRWARVYAIGPDQQEIKVGQYVYVAHGRWTRGVTIENEDGELVVRRVDNDDVLLISDELPSDDYVSDKT